MDLLKYIFQMTMSTGRLAKRQILLTEFEIIYVTQTVMNAQALADHLAKNPVDGTMNHWINIFPMKRLTQLRK